MNYELRAFPFHKDAIIDLENTHHTCKLDTICFKSMKATVGDLTIYWRAHETWNTQCSIAGMAFNRIQVSCWVEHRNHAFLMSRIRGEGKIYPLHVFYGEPVNHF